MAALKAGALLSQAGETAMRVVETPINLIERMFGRKRMPWLFLAPNLVLFAIFTFLPIAIAIGYAFTGGTNLFVSERPSSAWTISARCFPAAIICSREPARNRCSGRLCGTRSGSWPSMSSPHCWWR